MGDGPGNTDIVRRLGVTGVLYIDNVFVGTDAITNHLF